MTKQANDWPEPKMTGNAELLTGFLAGMLSTREDHYRAVEFLTIGGGLIVRNTKTGNRFSVTVRQIGGQE